MLRLNLLGEIESLGCDERSESPLREWAHTGKFPIGHLATCACIEPQAPKAKSMHTLYILHCSDDSFYTGITRHVRRRLKQHREGEVVYTSTRLPVQLVHQEDFASEEEAVSREKQVKGWTRRKKAALIAGEREKLRPFRFLSSLPLRSGVARRG